MKKNNIPMDNIDMHQFTRKLKEQDKHYADINKRAKVIYWVFVPVFLITFIAHIIEKNPLPEIIGSICFLFAMIIFLMVFTNLYKEYKYVDYSLPTIEMLKKAAQRYKPFRLKNLGLILAVIFIDAGLCLNATLDFDYIHVQVVFLGAIIIASITGLLIWRAKYKPIRDAALALIREIEK